MASDSIDDNNNAIHHHKKKLSILFRLPNPSDDIDEVNEEQTQVTSLKCLNGNAVTYEDDKPPFKSSLKYSTSKQSYSGESKSRLQLSALSKLQEVPEQSSHGLHLKESANYLNYVQRKRIRSCSSAQLRSDKTDQLNHLHLRNRIQSANVYSQNTPDRFASIKTFVIQKPGEYTNNAKRGSLLPCSSHSKSKEMSRIMKYEKSLKLRQKFPVLGHPRSSCDPKKLPVLGHTTSSFDPNVQSTNTFQTDSRTPTLDEDLQKFLTIGFMDCRLNGNLKLTHKKPSLFGRRVNNYVESSHDLPDFKQERHALSANTVVLHRRKQVLSDH